MIFVLSSQNYKYLKLGRELTDGEMQSVTAKQSQE